MIDEAPIPQGTQALPQRLVRDLYDHQIAPEAMVALGLYPLIHVAWADGRIQAAERELVVDRVAAAGFAKPARKLIAHWLARPAQRPDALLDLAWQLVERLPPPLQRMAAQDAVRQAMAVAMAAGPEAAPVEPSEEAALAEVVAALGGRSAETARREALLFGLQVEDRLPGYELLPPGERLAATGTAANPDMDAALEPLVRPGPIHRRIAWRPPSGRRRLFDLIARAHRESAGDRLDSLGLAGPLDGLDAWQVCRFIVWLVCAGSTYDPAYRSSNGVEEQQAQADDSEVEWLEKNIKAARPTRDSVSSLELLRGVLNVDDTPLICRDYVRLVVELFEACRGHLSACRQARVIPVMGNHDLRSFAGHAWCLFLDTRLRASVALDPTAADGLWDAGWADGPFNDLLDARGLNTASAILSRLVGEPTLDGLHAAAAMIRALPRMQRPWLMARTLAQGLTGLDLEVGELRHLFQAAQVDGIPPALGEAALQRQAAYKDLGAGHTADADEPLRRGRLAWLVCESGLLDRADLPARLAADLDALEVWKRERSAKRAGVGRNDPCPCGSGKKYKKCCGRRD